MRARSVARSHTDAPLPKVVLGGQQPQALGPYYNFVTSADPAQPAPWRSMTISDYYSVNGSELRITSQQASDFAKTVAGDFNPLHDPDARRFCVPGDLLFAYLLQRYGLSQRMHFRFSGMVGRDVPLHIEEAPGDEFEVRDVDGKSYLTVSRSGGNSQDIDLVRQVTCGYVEFSGQNFPHILVPLLREQGVMFNVDRPMVIYESMSFELDTLEAEDVELRLANKVLDVNGKRGEVRLGFDFLAGGEIIGKGHKRLLLAGLRPYEQEDIDRLVTKFVERRASYQATGTW